MSKEAALNLSSWILRRYPYGDPITHLKLQKLTFYAYGFGAARSFQVELGTIAFEPWEHGPVNRAVWDEYKVHGAAPLPLPPSDPKTYSAPLEALLANVLRVYGLLDAWAIRQQTHTEEPWDSAYKRRASSIDDAKLVAHFRAKSSARFRLPEYLFDRGSFHLDGAPTVGIDFDSLESAAKTLEKFFPIAS